MQQLKNVGIGAYFERSFSVDAVRKFKPAADVYPLAATELQIAPSQLRLVVRTRGTCSVPCAPAAQRPLSQGWGRLADTPDIAGPDLRNVADQIVRRDAAQ